MLAWIRLEVKLAKNSLGLASPSSSKAFSSRSSWAVAEVARRSVTRQ